MNRLSMENRTEPITKDLDFQLQDPFLLYRNARLSIYGIWFYDKEECQRIAELMKNLTQQEQLKAQQGAGIGISPVSLNSGDSKEVDILQMLTKAKYEYTKCKTCSEPKQITSSSAIYDNPNLIKPIPVKPSETQHQCIPQQIQNIDPEPQHLSLTTLFGKQEKSNPYQDTSERTQKQHQENFPLRQGVVRSLSYEEPNRHSPTAEKQLCPAIQKLMVRGAELHPVSELPENRLCENGNIHSVGDVFTGLFQPVASHSFRTSHSVQDAASTRSLLQQLQGQSKMEPSDAGPANSAASVFSRTPAVSSVAQGRNVTQPHLMYFNGSLSGQGLGPPAIGKEASKLPGQPLPLSGNQPNNSGVISPQELLKKLQIVQQEQQLHVSSRPTLAAKFPVVPQSTSTLKPLDSWMDKVSNTEKQPPLFQVISPQQIPATTVTTSLLMSPMVFSQSAPAPPKPSESGWLPAVNQEAAASSTNLLLPMQNPEPSVPNSNPLTKLQLQETLLHLIQNDDNFLSIIYDAYLVSVRKTALKKPM
ncbi:mRNA-decapping enzyme 1B isoform X2 [Hemicordylus capensis]|nr:mRNA-decapping enzyme 1B isoform X2 [Hemicordylus capensis]XP_053110997.1 mRNA-decapping enzyme 1B isoform X2 [Hemicordylus capensis]XP_053110998.1 mRNA-decapping enzyme 1B isoform X2 [Hemicordylus capensis]XP_053110999.1 mRNA-decapping enzyme 1B isoform X2 [Hemicordylus capensis]XP_053111000.1 mRNA-decapping enzyme 1B isoform X2 [Hemicordylus capensis]XP_053111001.1 mRNA-decapping enzyme 1B isoform X2 [Hemicordylus capensis]XP_053111002.1 mRNA-decapping enzyme 1B isoform X2 [Hemicordylus 